MDREVFDKLFLMNTEQRAAERDTVAAQTPVNTGYLADIDTFNAAFAVVRKSRTNVG